MNAPRSIASWAHLARSLAVACLAAGALTPAMAARPSPIVYDDLDAFATAMATIDAGTAPQQAMAAYLAAASPGMQIFTTRFGVTPESMAARVDRYPRYYRHLATLRPQVQAFEPEIRAALAKLHKAAPHDARPVAVYYLVANMRAGGNPGMVKTAQGMQPAIGIAIDLMAMSTQVDRSELPRGTVGIRLADIPFSVVHEMAHVLQSQVQGLDAYRGMYADPARSTNLAFAVREGCADFLTWQASGWDLDGRQAFVKANERKLWAAFHPILHERMSPQQPWFGPPTADRPDWPMQIGYGVGMAMCQAFYDDAADKTAAMRAIYGAHLPEHFEAIARPYAARMAN